MRRNLMHTVAVCSLGLICAQACGESNSTAPVPSVEKTGVESTVDGAPADAQNRVLWQTDPEAAFEDARSSNRPVMLYFTADWCPPCHDLKAHVFPQPSFVEKSRLFVPVYLDGDAPQTQAWAEELGIVGYPTMVVLDSDRTELVRVSGGMNLAAYEEVLVTALSASQPLDELLASIDGPDELSLASCRRLAYHAWSNDTAYSDSEYEVGIKLLSASRRCPAELSTLRARMTIAGATLLAPASAADLEASGEIGSVMREALEDVYELSLDPQLADPNALVVLNAPQEYFALSGQFGEAEDLDVVTPWAESLARFASDPGNTSYTRLYAIGGRLSLMRDPEGNLNKADVVNARNAVTRFLEQEDSTYGRSALLVPAVYTLSTIGDDEAAEALLLEEMAQAKAPYYQMSSLARLMENRGDRLQALDWFERAYDDSSGFETRLQWGSNYARACMRLAPDDSDRIVAASIDVIEELDGANWSARTRRYIDRLATSLEEWNVDGNRDAALAKIRSAMLAVCTTSQPESDAACKGFLVPTPRT